MKKEIVTHIMAKAGNEKKYKNQYLTKDLNDTQKRFLGMIPKCGGNVSAALSLVSRTKETLRRWNRNPYFAECVDEAVANSKQDISDDVILMEARRTVFEAISIEKNANVALKVLTECFEWKPKQTEKESVTLEVAKKKFQEILDNEKKIKEQFGDL